ncbi:Ppx/GppA phosphatase family protein [Roseateles sp. P5_E1]
MPDLLPSCSPTLAAIDLGSNSFRLEIARVTQNRYQRQVCIKEMVSLGAGLDSRGVLSRESMVRGLRCLQGFSSELVRHDLAGARVVATQTLREASNRDEFLHRAQTLLGLPIDVISGHEEARLIYAGVAFMHPSPGRRLVVDIGGRSTEMIVGQGGAQRVTQSFPVGSASVAHRFFPGGRMTEDAFRAAQLVIGESVCQALAPFAAVHWDEALGASGTARSLSCVLKATGVTDGAITPKALRWLIKRCVAAGHVDKLDLPGLKPHRRGVLPGGLSILYALVMHCGIRRMLPAKGALRQGVIVDLLGQPKRNADVGTTSVRLRSQVPKLAAA